MGNDPLSPGQQLPRPADDVRPEGMVEPEQAPPEVSVTPADHRHLSEREKVRPAELRVDDPGLENLFKKPGELSPLTPAREAEMHLTNTHDNQVLSRWRRLLHVGRGLKHYHHPENLAKILAGAKANGKVTNDDVERLLGVSDRQASRYLNELARQGKLVKYGRFKQTFYKLPV
jgi:hypothetical protein